MPLTFFDSHCHPQAEQYAADRDDVLARMQQQGVGGIVVGTDLAQSRAALMLARGHEFLWASVGLHPTDNAEERFDAGAYRLLARDSSVVAIGECGLDYYRGEPSSGAKAAQEDRFRQQLELSLEVRKPLIIHCRPSPATQNAHEDMLRILSAYEPDMHHRAVIHFFTSTSEIARRYIQLGCYLSFSGVITFADLDGVVEATPLDRILSETDSPYAAPTPYRGRRNEPVHVAEVVAAIARLKEHSMEDTARQIIHNSVQAFNILA